MVKPHRLERYGAEPKCPRCGHQGYDDWWHVLRVRTVGARPRGKLQCGSCEKAFFIEGVPGDLFSTAFGLDTTDLQMRAVGL